MKTLWAENKAMIASDFVQLDSSLNLNSVNHLYGRYSKNYIEVSGIVYSGKVLTKVMFLQFLLMNMLLKILTE